MSSKLSRITSLAVGILVVFATAQGAQGQSGEDLVNQLRGQGPAPKRNAQQLEQAYQEAVNYLLPLMSADDIGSRYDNQIALQDMGSYAARPGAETQREALARVLCRTVETAKMPATVRNWFVLQLQRIGKAESVKTLTNLLSSRDKELRDYARRALEKNPSKAALQSLERELKEANDPGWKIALLHSLSQRSEPGVIDVVSPALQDSSPEVAAAAISAVAETHSPKTVTILEDLLKKASGSNQMLTARRLVEVADRLIKRQKFERALKAYVELNSWAIAQEKGRGGRDVFFIRAAALNGIATCDGRRAVEVVTAAMQSENPKIRAVAVKAARNAPTKGAMRALTRMLPKLEPFYQQQVLGLIADRGDLSSVRPVKAILKSDDESTRLAAIDTLTRLGGDEAAKALLRVATAGEGATQKAAYKGLSVMVGPRVEDVVKAAAASGDVDSRVVGIGLLGERRTPGALERLLSYAGESDSRISAAAFKAVAAVAGPADIPTLTDLLVKTTGSQVRENAVTTLKSVLGKAQDKDAAARAIIERMGTSSPETKLSLLTTLNALGGATALKAVVDAARSSDAATCDVGIRTLSAWPDYEAAPILLEIALRPETSLTHYVLAVNGALRLVKTATTAPLSSRAELCLAAFDHARRDQEKKLAVSAMGFVPDNRVAQRLEQLFKNDNLKVEAGLAAVELARNMTATDRRAARDLAQKVRDANISNDINRRADRLLNGRRRR
jgi:HEAT repeat protein